VTATEPVGSAGDRRSATDRLRDDLRAVLPSYITARILVVAAWVLSLAVSDWLVPGGRTLHQVLGLTSWDAAWYRGIADVGYGGVVGEAIRFFPLYPLVGKVLVPLVGGNVDLAMVLAANIAALGAGVLLRRLVLFERGPGATALAERAVWVLNLSPASFVLVFGYSEALFVVLAVGAVLAARRGWFVAAGACACGAALTRPLGVLLAAPLLIEAVRPWLPRLGGTRSLRDLSVREGAARLWAVVAPVLGVGVFLGWVGRTFGDPMLPFSAQGQYRETVDPLHRVGRGLLDMIGTERFGDGLHVPFVIAFVVLLVVVGRRWPACYTAFAALVLLVTVSSQNLNSTERYGMLNAFPLVLALAEVLDTRRKERIGLAVCANGFVALCALAWTAVYVP
jgi:hypothetical protein